MRSFEAFPPLSEILERTRVVTIATRTRFRGVSQREAALFDAPNGASEFSPFIEYADDEAASWLAAAIEYGWGELPSIRKTTIPINATVPAVSAEQVPEVLARFDGCRTAKVKVAERGQSLADDIARVRAVREEMGDDAVIRVDANAGWSVDEAVTALRALAPFGLDYAEQPCASVAELVEVRRQLTPTTDQKVCGSDATTGIHENPKFAAPKPTLVRIAADESVRKAEDPLTVARAGAADLLIVKAQPLGGITRALHIIKEAGLPVVVSSALDTSIGIGMGLHLAAALPDGVLAGACGLGTVSLLAGDVTRDQLVARNGEIEVRRPELDAALLDHYAAAGEREAWWRDRITRCYALLASRTG